MKSDKDPNFFDIYVWQLDAVSGLQDYTMISAFRAYSRNLGQRSILARKSTFLWKKATKNFLALSYWISCYCRRCHMHDISLILFLTQMEWLLIYNGKLRNTWAGPFNSLSSVEINSLCSTNHPVSSIKGVTNLVNQRWLVLSQTT